MLTKSDFVKHEECPIWLWLHGARAGLPIWRTVKCCARLTI